MKRLRIVFLGMGGDFMFAPMRAAARHHDIVGLVLARSGKREFASPGTVSAVKVILRQAKFEIITRNILRVSARRPGIKVMLYDAHEPLALVPELSALNADVFCVAGFPELLRSEIFGIPDSGTINMHPSFLPDYRGPNPFFWVYYNREEESGVTVHEIDEKEDTGRILLQEKIKIPFGMPGNELVAASIRTGSRLMADVLDLLSQGRLQAQENPGQSRTARAYRPGANREYIEWDEWPVERVYHFLSGVMPQWYVPPVLAGLLRDGWRLKTYVTAPPEGKPGTLAIRADRTFVWCMDGRLEFCPVGMCDRVCGRLKSVLR